MKLSFTIPSKPSSSKQPPSQTNQDERSPKDYVTEFDPSKTLPSQSSEHNHVIPPISNEWRPHKRMKNLDLPLQSQSDGSHDLQFEVESPSAVHAHDDKMSYGLNLRQTSTTNGDDLADGNGRPRSAAPSVENMLLDKLREDLKRLPEDRGFEEFEDVPVEGFGAALLAGYGWRQGRGIGRNHEKDVEVKIYKKRTDKEGLGFVASHKEKEKEKEKDKERGRERDANVDRDGDRIYVGKDVRVITGRDMGSKGMIVERLGSDWVVLKLSKSRGELKVRVSEIADLGSMEDEKCFRKLKDLRLREKESNNHRENEKGATTVKRSRETEKRGGGTAGDVRVEKNRVEVSKERISWLRSHIRVRIVDKDFEGGRFYLKKGEVVDVVGPHMCDISMDDSRELVQGVDQGLLETALPRRGGPVLVLYGKYNGVYGNLVERDLDREVGVVQDADSHQFVNVKLEQIAEYIGDPSYIGY